MGKRKSRIKKNLNEMKEDAGRVSEFAKLYSDTVKEFRPGQIVTGRILRTGGKEVLVDIGYKSEGFVRAEEFKEPENLKPEDQVDVMIERLEDEDGRVVLSREKAERLRGWEMISASFNEGSNIKGRVVKKVKGGLIVDIGVEAFLPMSLVALKGYPNTSELIGKTMDFKIVKMNKQRRNVVVSRKDILAKEREEQKETFFGDIKAGELRQGVVKNITDFGAFISLGPVDGLLHITDMSWGRISHPSEMLALGDKIDVFVLDFDKATNKVSLGLKQKTANPWETVDEKYPVGSKVKGRVTNILPYGAFVELEKGVEGLVHVSEISWTKRIGHANEVLAIGDVVEVVVLSIDKDRQKISLGIKQTETNPWLEIPAKYPVGTKLKAKVRTLTDYGAFVELEDGIDGLIHVSDMSWTKKVMHPSEILKKGQKVEAVVLNVDADAKKISLGLKQAVPDPWPELAEKYRPDAVLEGEVTKITSFGVFVALEPELEGLVHISEVDPSVPKPIEAGLKAQTKIKVRILRVDTQQRRIALSMKDTGGENAGAGDQSGP